MGKKYTRRSRRRRVVRRRRTRRARSRRYRPKKISDYKNIYVTIAGKYGLGLTL